jgi:hypothetical protein
MTEVTFQSLDLRHDRIGNSSSTLLRTRVPLCTDVVALRSKVDIER